MNPQNPIPPVPQPVIPAVPVVPTKPQAPIQQPVVQPTVNTALNYATFGQRFWAVLLDGIILAVISSIVSVVATTLTNDSGALSPIISLLGYFISLAYPIYFIGKNGATPGKMALKIKVIRKDTTEEVGYLNAFLRESVGKLLSSFLLIGYFVMLKDPSKQTWHDKIAGTVVIKSNT